MLSPRNSRFSVSAFVLDTSIALKWLLEDEHDRAYSVALLHSVGDEHRPIVPWLWFYEMANAILVQIRRERISAEEASAFLRLIGEMPIEVDTPDRLAILQPFRFARQNRLTCYDAAFLDLARRLNAPLATDDKELIRAASECGVQLFAA